MKASESTVRQVLQGETQYVVPLYQRRYSWQHGKEKDPLGQLWDDLMVLVGDNGSATHFLGSIVLAPSPDTTAGGLTRWIVVDGQQRLTTLSLLLCAVRDHVHAAHPQLAEKIHDLHLVNKYAAGDDRYRLLPTQADRASWVALVERAPDAGGEDRIGSAYRWFRAKLAEFDDPDDDADVRALEQAVTGRLALVSISAHADDNVHRIFESLNHKGQPLTQADLLRNYLFMKLPTLGDHVYTSQWLPLQTLLDDAQLDELVWLDLVVAGDEKATQTAIYRLQQSRLDRLSEEEIANWVERLHHRALLLRRILRPVEEPVPVLRDALDRLSRWGSTVVHPIALHVLESHDAGRVDAAEAARALRVVESFQVRRMVVGIPTNNLNRILMSLVKELGAEPPTAEAVTRVLSGPRKRFPSDQQVRDAVLVEPFYFRGRGHQQRFVLRSLEEDLRHGEQIAFDLVDLSIEHVLPQSPSEKWLSELAVEADHSESPEEVHTSVVHTLGNLTLTAYNQQLSNSDFDVKRVQLADSGLKTNRLIAENEQWRRAEIRARSRMLADRVVAIWPGPDESVAAYPIEPRWRLMSQVLASVPAGRWTSYSDVAEVIGSHQVAVGNRLATVTMSNAHRVLKRNGHISPEFRWPDPERDDDPREVLQAEGVRFDGWGRAQQEQRVDAEQLMAMIAEDRD
ncbi:GmrSD restriction endonuclease domain-containing protein [Pseudonocardia xinjiangensis]|uniref:GmrSD restriction endonuclease domain-containing protein n=1 Tax=Pseudonocardia xinjiangensis TaxID=75289 RepID=UPI003D93DE02